MRGGRWGTGWVPTGATRTASTAATVAQTAGLLVVEASQSMP